MTTVARIGLIGFGLAGSAFHAPFIATTPGLELTVIVTRDAERAAQASSRYPGVITVDSADDLWELGLAAVVIATPNSTHVPLAGQAIAHGVAAIVDKPFALSAAQGIELIGQAEAANVGLTTFQNRRWDGDFLTLTELVRSGRLGNVARFESRFERWRPIVAGTWKDELTTAEGGGILFDLGSHLIDQALHLFGPASHVYAEVDTTRSGAHNDDDTFVALTHLSGVRSHLFMNAVAADLGPRFRILGTEGAYLTYGLDTQEDALRAGVIPTAPGFGSVAESAWGVLSGGPVTEVVPTLSGDYADFYRRVAAALTEGAPMPVDPRDAVATLQVIEAARRSSTDNVVVTL